MKRLVVYIAIPILLLTSQSFAQMGKETKHKPLDKTLDTVVLINKIDLNLISVKQERNQNNLDWNKIMPWLGALFVGIITVGVNVWNNKRVTKTSLQITNKQIDSINANSIAQIQLLKENSIREFNKSVVSGNRQSWLSEIRETMVDIIDLLYSFKIKQNINDEDYKKLKLLVIKSELMFSADDDESFVLKLKDLLDSCHNILLKLKSVDELEQLIIDIKMLTVEKIKNEWANIIRVN